jgi:DivIVA domain-containing protein
VLTVLSVLGVLAVLFVAAVIATREGPILADAPVDIADVQLPDGPLQPEDLRAVRFALAVRGYRMDEVDRVIERAATELAERDQQILELRGAGSGPAAVPAAVLSPLATVVVAKPAAAGTGDEPDHEPDDDHGPGDGGPDDEAIVPPEPAAPVVAQPVAGPDEPAAAEDVLTEDMVDGAVDGSADVDDVTTEDIADGTADGSANGSVDVQDVTTEDVLDDLVASDADEVAEREPVASLLPDPAGDGGTEEPDAPSDDTADADIVEPPPPPPIQVAVVRTEVAPLPASTTVPREAEDAPGKD